MKHIMTHFIFIFITATSLNIVTANAATNDQIDGTWVAKKYISCEFGSVKKSKLPKLVIRPEHFGQFMYSTDQNLRIVFPSPPEKRTSGKIPGKIETSGPLLDPGCALMDAYKKTMGCSNKSLKDVDVNFRIFDLDKVPSDSDEKAFRECWNTNKINDISQSFTMLFSDYSSHLGFVGRENLLLRASYYEKALQNPGDALNFGCPPGNRCWTVFLQFARVRK